MMREMLEEQENLPIENKNITKENQINTNELGKNTEILDQEAIEREERKKMAEYRAEINNSSEIKTENHLPEEIVAELKKALESNGELDTAKHSSIIDCLVKILNEKVGENKSMPEISNILNTARVENNDTIVMYRICRNGRVYKIIFHFDTQNIKKDSIAVSIESSYNLEQ
jgi:hypothetical protein